MRKKQISSSMMCIDFMDVCGELATMEKHGIEYLHMDIMDGEFVNNYTLGTNFCEVMKKNSSIPLDIHLMVEKPENKLSWFAFGEGDYVSVHYESTRHIQRALGQIKQRGAKAMIALNPATPLEVLEWVLPDIDAVLLMTVNPGFAGQKLVPQMLEKIVACRKFLDERGYENVEIEVDGNVSFENARKMSDAGADIFVAGSSSMFAKDMTLDQGIERLREAIR